MKTKTFIIFIVIALAFIWGHSMLSGDISSGESTGIKQIMQAVLDFLHIPVTLTDTFVRKLAHFTEHAAAGLLLGLYLFPNRKDEADRRIRIMYAVLPFVLGFFIGFIDETIQLFSGRGPQIQDVWIDFMGVVTGAFISMIIIYLVRRRRLKKNAAGQQEQ